MGACSDSGIDEMQVLLAAKMNHWSWVVQCQEADTCPELNPRPSHTLQPVACVDGKTPVHATSF